MNKETKEVFDYDEEVRLQIAETIDVEELVLNASEEGIELEVSMEYMVEFAQKHDLTIGNIVEVISLHKNYKANLGYISRLLSFGASVEQIQAAYMAREVIGPQDNDNDPAYSEFGEFIGWRITGISLIRVVEFLEYFPDTLIEPEMAGDQIAGICEEVMEAVDWVYDEDMALRFLCLVAQGYGVDNVDAAMALVTGAGFSFMNNDQLEE